MKRLFRIAGSTLMLSLFPMLSWLMLGIVLDSNLINVFSLSYPIQFLFLVLLSIFATGANIKQIKEKNEDAFLSGLTIGIFAGLITLILFIVFTDKYIVFMGMDPLTYRVFTIYSFVSIFIRYVFQMILENMYFEDRDKEAYRHSLVFNILNFVILISVSLITNNSIVIISVTLFSILIYVIVLLIKTYRKFHIDFNLISNIKYESVSIVTWLLLFLTYFIGFGNAFNAGPEYINAINFVTLITDTQWDCSEAISTVAKIDIANGNYNFKKTMKNSFIFSLILVATSLVAYCALFSIYEVNFGLGLLCLSVDLIDFMYNPIGYGFEPYVQLEYSSSKNTIIAMISFGVRFLLSSFLPTAFCTQIAQIVASTLIIVMLLIIKVKHFKTTPSGTLERKSKKEEGVLL